MNRFLSRVALGCLIAAVCASPALAAGKKNKGQKDPTASLEKKLQKADLPTDAKEKADKVLADYRPKLREAQRAADDVLTAEQKAAKASAQKAARQAGKKRKEAAAEVAAALRLTDEQKVKYDAAEKHLKKVQNEMSGALKGVLTSEQLAKVGIKARKKNKT
jgi:hypothetical protein